MCPGGGTLCWGVTPGGQPRGTLRMPDAGGQPWGAAPQRAAVRGNRVGSREYASSQEAILSRADSRDSWRCSSDAQPRGFSVSDANGPLAMHIRGASRSVGSTGLSVCDCRDLHCPLTSHLFYQTALC